MKRNRILRVSILPLVLITVVSFTNLQPQKKDNGNKSQEQSEDKGKDQKQKGNDDHNSQGNSNQGKNQNESKANNAQSNNSNKGNDHQVNNSNKGNDHQGNGNSGKEKGNENAGHSKMSHGNGNSKTMNGKRDTDIDWNLNDFANRKHPKDQKKVTICHNPSGDGSNSVSLNISENAVKAHMNHGDQMGTCTNNYSDRWSSNYIQSRENVYNTYEQTYETMSYSEAILKVALNKLLGIRTNLDVNRTTYTTQEIQRREALIYDLQNNVTSLENQLGATRQQMDSDVNIIIKL